MSQGLELHLIVAAVAKVKSMLFDSGSKMTRLLKGWAAASNQSPLDIGHAPISTSPQICPIPPPKTGQPRPPAAAEVFTRAPHTPQLFPLPSFIINSSLVESLPGHDWHVGERHATLSLHPMLPKHSFKVSHFFAFSDQGTPRTTQVQSCH